MSKQVSSIAVGRRRFTFLSVVLLVLCLATAMLWVRSYQKEDRFSHVVRGDRYSVTSVAGRIAISSPPPPASDAQTRQAVREAVAALRNDQVCWIVTFWDGARWGGPSDFTIASPEPLIDTPAEQIDSLFASHGVTRPLPDALADPNRFAAAHMLLLRKYSPEWQQRIFELPSKAVPVAGCLPDERCHHGDHQRVPWIQVNHDDLSVILCRWMAWSRAPVMGKDLDEHPMEGDPDVGQLEAIRDKWHRRLDVEVVAVPHWKLAAGAGLLPLLLLGRSIRMALSRRAIRRLGKCRICGYDLRATPARCPECGTASDGVAA